MTALVVVPPRAPKIHFMMFLDVSWRLDVMIHVLDLSQFISSICVYVCRSVSHGTRRIYGMVDGKATVKFSGME